MCSVTPFFLHHCKSISVECMHYIIHYYTLFPFPPWITGVHVSNQTTPVFQSPLLVSTRGTFCFLFPAFVTSTIHLTYRTHMRVTKVPLPEHPGHFCKFGTLPKGPSKVKLSFKIKGQKPHWVNATPKYKTAQQHLNMHREIQMDSITVTTHTCLALGPNGVIEKGYYYIIIKECDCCIV